MSASAEEIFETVLGETFSKASKAHIAGDVKLAENLYNEILMVEPMNAEVIHNLGILALQDGRTQIALSSLEKALEINPNKENFWLSYINALIDEKLFQTARETIDEAKRLGVSKDNLRKWEASLSSLDTISNLSKEQVQEVWIKWKNENSTAGNTHLSFDKAKCKSIPFRDDKVWLRPTFSDTARVQEYLNDIYFRKNWLHDVLLKLKPTLLIDVGANIGLSSLSLIKEFSSLKKVIAIEAESKNFGLLKANFDLWSSKYSNIDWVALNAVATSSEGAKIRKTQGLFDVKKGHSVSGTFKYELANECLSHEQNFEKTVSLKSIIDSISQDQRIVAKIDIEGGEQHLFEADTEWLKRCHFLTCEVHDGFHPIMLNSSRNMIKAFVDHDFVIVPSNNLLHCYNRNMIGEVN